MTGTPIRILSTRPTDPSLIKQAAEKGILLESLSFIETSPIPGEELYRKIAELAGDAEIILFTSMNAVDAVVDCLGASGPIAIPGRIFCIGSVTKEKVIEYFGEDRIAGTADSAADLADRIIGEGNIKEVAFFCGDQRRDELPKRLWEAGVRVKELVVYHTRLTPHTIMTPYDGIVFFSPSAVNSFFSANTLSADTLLFAIGHTTAETIREFCINPVIVSDSTRKTALIRQVIDHFGPSLKEL